MPPASLHILLAGLVDYAGLFPPAALSMREVVSNYASYRQSSDAWALGRLIVPAARLSQLSECMAPLELRTKDAWRISVLAGNDLALDAECIARWNGAMLGVAVADSVEVRASSPEAVARAAHLFGEAIAVYVELPHDDDPAHLVAAVARAGVRAKIRAGGVTVDAFPAAAQVVRFLRRCAEHDVAFKATAGLHHPLRNAYPLTFAPDAATADMFGFLNLFLAAAFVRKGLPDREVMPLLEERDPHSLRFTADAICWRDEELDMQRLADIRTSFAIAFGSCSFREPIDDLHQLGLL